MKALTPGRPSDDRAHGGRRAARHHPTPGRYLGDYYTRYTDDLVLTAAGATPFTLPAEEGDYVRSGWLVLRGL